MDLTADDTVVVAIRSSKTFHEPDGDLDDDPLPACGSPAAGGFRWSTEEAVSPVYTPCERCFD